MHRKVARLAKTEIKSFSGRSKYYLLLNLHKTILRQLSNTMRTTMCTLSMRDPNSVQHTYWRTLTRSHTDLISAENIGNGEHIFVGTELYLIRRYLL